MSTEIKEPTTPRKLPPDFDLASRMINLKGKWYMPVAPRITWFRLDHETWGIETEPTAYDFSPEGGYAVFKATITDESGRIIATGHKQESRLDFGDFFEKAETGAIGRALLIAGYGTDFAQELDEGERLADAPREPLSGRQPAPAPFATFAKQQGTPAQPKCADCGKNITAARAQIATQNFGHAVCVACAETLKPTVPQTSAKPTTRANAPREMTEYECLGCGKPMDAKAVAFCRPNGQYPEKPLMCYECKVLKKLPKPDGWQPIGLKPVAAAPKPATVDHTNETVDDLDDPFIEE